MFHPIQQVFRFAPGDRPQSKSARAFFPRRRGQVAIFLLLLITALAFVLLWNVDIHRIITTKTRTQNAGDAAALAAARWQGISLNLVGELNLLHALALSVNDPAAVDAITNIQARVLFTGPLAGLAAAQVAAKNNGMYADDGFTQIVLQHAEDVSHYGDLNGGVPIFASPYPGAWEDYANMLTALAGDGIAAGPDNTFFYNDGIGGHILLDRAFYDAVAGRTWCWFYNQDPYYQYPSPLSDYTDCHFWHPLPPPSVQHAYNCEFLPLWLLPVTVPLETVFTNSNDLLDEAARIGVNMMGFVATNVMTKPETWYVYNSSWWGTWDLMATEGASDPFPATGPVKTEYNYAGADAMFRVYASVDRMTPGLSGSGTNQDQILWTAAAKAFGAVGPDGDRLPPTRYSLVLPAFSDVRLIPVDACSGSGNGAFDLAWRQHVDVHLPQYMASGPQSNDGCPYCAQLITWENPAFRQEGIAWLSTNNYLCTLPSGPGPGGGNGGGRRRGH